MVLGFKQKIGKVETYFVEKILAFVYAEIAKHFPNPKIHTIRQGNRWRKGMSIQMATGVRTKKYKQFNKGLPDLSTCKHTQKIEIIWGKDSMGKHVLVLIDDEIVSNNKKIIDQLVVNDGFESKKQFFQYFNTNFSGQIVHWTDFKY